MRLAASGWRCCARECAEAGEAWEVSRAQQASADVAVK